MRFLDQMEGFYSNKLFGKLRKLAEPLKTFYGLDTFNYSRTTSDGRVIQCSNDPEPNLFFFRQDLARHSPFMCHPDCYTHNQSIITAGFPDTSYQDAVKIVEAKYGIGNLLLIYKKEKDCAHVLLFSSTNTKLPLNTIFLNHFNTLHAFSDHFMSEWGPHLPEIEKYMIDAEQLMGPIFNKKSPLLTTLPTKRETLGFLKSIQSLDHKAARVRFSPQELRCIKLLLEDHASAREIAEQLGLSTRTIESYIDNIKSKLGCFSKSELVTKLNKYRQHHLLDLEDIHDP